MKQNHPARGGAGNASQMGNLQEHSTASREVDTPRPRVGEIVEVNGLPGRFLVTANDDPATLTLENDRRVQLRVGERQVRRLALPR